MARSSSHNIDAMDRNLSDSVSEMQAVKQEWETKLQVTTEQLNLQLAEARQENEDARRQHEIQKEALLGKVRELESRQADLVQQRAGEQASEQL